LHIVGSTSTLDVPRLVVQSSSDGQRLLMEVPYLSISSVWSLNDHVSVVDQIKVSVLFHLRYNVEIFFNNKTVFFIELSLYWFTLPFINVDNVPLLVKTIVSSLNTNVSVLLVDVANNFHDFTSLVDNVMVLEPEHLPPSRVSSSASQVV
jgi:hypothetical protein